MVRRPESSETKQKIKMNKIDDEADIGLYDFNKVTEQDDDDVVETDRSFTRSKNFESRQSILVAGGQRS